MKSIKKQKREIAHKDTHINFIPTNDPKWLMLGTVRLTEYNRDKCYLCCDECRNLIKT